MCTIIRLIDARGSESPIPLMELIRSLKSSEEGDVVHILANDQSSVRDIPIWTQKMGHQLLYTHKEKNYWKIAIRKKVKKTSNP
ncbi:conserved hypothetical protein [[Clostridium] ultunense Esp]|uniref:sulfurtransferase TusA family protein n=1 Tax=Thermicanus aegyptius TaxID=94009 RepID=UPI0002B6FDC7|nr:sulfurtransferase TusA family protein [Thermicanus aegyptius]CCQ98419.1 conserved hypothetical protein [[Clostridium] ultunense Esp]